MKNLLYFAVYGFGEHRLPENSEAVYGGFGFRHDGSLRLPYMPPKNAIVVFDDRVVPKHLEKDVLNDFSEKNEIREIIFDFERYHGDMTDLTLPIPCSMLMLPYRPQSTFEQYLKTVKAAKGQAVLDLCPVNICLSGGMWREDRSIPEEGHFSKKHLCMYRIGRGKGNTAIRFYDTKKTVRLRAEASGLPCLLPFAEYEHIPEG